jgi:hypothetical protein
VNREKRGETMPLVTLGGDVGARDVGWAVLDDTLLAHGVWDLEEAPVDWPPEAWLVEQTRRHIRRSRVALLAVEVFHWRPASGPVSGCGPHARPGRSGRQRARPPVPRPRAWGRLA